MSHLPELRASLVRAAQRQSAAAGSTQPRRGRSRPSFAAVATGLASLAVVAVAALAIAVIGHGGRGGGAAAPGASSATRAAARATATHLLDQVVLPAGSVALGPDPTGQLGSPSDRLGTAYLVDVHRFWRVPGGPGSVMRFLRAHRPPGSRLTTGTSSGSGQAARAGSGKRGTFTITQATDVFDYLVPTRQIIFREVAVGAVAVAGGASIVRVDAEAGWLLPRPAGERIPAGVDLVRVTTRKALAGHRPAVRTRLITARSGVLALSILLDTFPRVQPGVKLPTVPCTRRDVVTVRFAFYARGAATPAAIFDNDPSCGVLRVSIGGRRQPDLTYVGPSANPRAVISRIRALFSFAPRP